MAGIHDCVSWLNITVEQLERLVKETAKDEVLKDTLLGKSTALEESKATLARQQERLQVSFQIRYTGLFAVLFSQQDSLVTLVRAARNCILSLACTGIRASRSGRVRTPKTAYRVLPKGKNGV